jgi:hypothetical protein
MDTTLARHITELVDEIDTLDADCDEVETGEELDDFKARIGQLQAQLEVLIHTAQKQLIFDVARQVTLESYRGTR